MCVLLYCMNYLWVILNVCELIYYKNREYNLVRFGCRSDFYFFGVIKYKEKVGSLVILDYVLNFVLLL